MEKAQMLLRVVETGVEQQALLGVPALLDARQRTHPLAADGKESTLADDAVARRLYRMQFMQATRRLSQSYANHP